VNNVLNALIIKLGSDQQTKDQNWGYSSAGRAPALHAGGLRFDPA
jgi:hypothetical protein